jgi:transcriptional regulator with XRE-family HTH domain
MTQEALAGAIGVTFQQVQKYENGISPVPEHRLTQISRSLDVAPAYFSDPRAEQTDAFEQFMQSPEGVALYRAMTRITDTKIRARLVMAITAFSDSLVRPEDADTQLLSVWFNRIASESKTARDSKTVGASIRAMRVDLAKLIGKTLKARKLTQKFAARILVTDQARVSDLARGNVERTSFEKLLRYLVMLGWNAHITVTRRPIHSAGKVELSSNGKP